MKSKGFEAKMEAISMIAIKALTTTLIAFISLSSLKNKKYR